MDENFWKSLSAQELSQNLSLGIKIFCESYVDQFSLRFPPGFLPTVDALREMYFPYLKNSVFKSNLCYLLQLLEYQVWLYKIFRPVYSLENSFFYQQLITLGIISEALAHAILLNPCIEENLDDNSLGKIKEECLKIHKEISRRNFSRNIEAIFSLGAINKDLRDKFHELRINIRNYVHLQTWEGRLYETIKLDIFKEKLEFFKNFLKNLKTQIKLNFTLADLQKLLISEEKEFFGEILNYDSQRGFGFIRCYDFPENVFFHISQVNLKKELLKKDLFVTFKVKETERGPNAVDIRIAHEAS